MAFAQEVKDFLTGYKAVREMGQTDEKGQLDREKMEADKAYQEAMLELRGQELDLQRQRLAQSAAGSAAAEGRAALAAERASTKWDWEREDRAYTLEERERARQEAARAVEVEGFEALGNEPVGWSAGTAPQPNEDVTGLAFAEGGLVPRALDWMRGTDRENPSSMSPDRMPANTGGTVMPGPEQDTPPATALPAPVTPAPTTPTRPAQPASTVMTRDVAPPESPSRSGVGSPTRNEISPEAIHIVVKRGQEAAQAGLTQLEKGFAVPRAALNTTNADPLEPEISMQELEAMRSTVDPNGEMPANLRALATMAEAHTYFRNKGEPEKAANAAKHYILAERRASQTQGVLAMNALREGDVVQACQLINNACERFPTAHEIQVTPGEGGMVNYSVKEAGKTLEEGQVSTNQLMEMTGQIADGSLFMNSLVNFVDSTSPPQQDKPSQALNTFSSAYSAAAQANAAFQDSMADGGQGDPALRAAAEAARTRVEEARAKALDLGLSMSDLSAAVRTDETLAAPGTSAGDLKPAPADVLASARAAIQGGADRAAVAKRLQENGFSDEGL